MVMKRLVSKISDRQHTSSSQYRYLMTLTTLIYVQYWHLYNRQTNA